MIIQEHNIITGSNYYFEPIKKSKQHNNATYDFNTSRQMDKKSYKRQDK